MGFRIEPGPIVVASHNPGKAREIVDLLGPFGFEIRSAAELGLPEPEETGATFAENAALKARAAATLSGLPAIADDSGLAIDALGGEPGIYSARWAGPSKDFDKAMCAVEEKLQAAGATTPERRRAHFVSALALALPDGAMEIFEGRVDGTLVWPPRGDQGFGYDPMFLPDGHSRTFGEMSAEEKHGWRPRSDKALSHRARAFRLLAREVLGVVS
jgi:XTP/dITP diphosphohydrolase